MAVPRNALRKREKVRDRALRLPGAAGDHPWGETAAETDRKVFDFPGVHDGSHPLGVTVTLTDETAHAHAPACPGAEPAGYGPGRAGRVRVPPEPADAPAAGLLGDRTEESCRTVAAERRAAGLDTRAAEPGAR
ncbi:dGTPase [Streptomyces sp. DH-12]|uniref:dGTPase n=1 Tax=Streptomyces sp. DH-12 TaxID=2072509 RepID=UPI000CCE8969|nr:dGTPase [Streptomyces sp. DH-12]PNV31632.1 dGTPase [Streptomyces sp. DH-12]